MISIRTAVLTAATLLGLAFSSVPARATDAGAGGLISELKVGALAHDVPYLWSHFQLERTAIDANFEVLFHPVGSVFGGELRPAVGATLNPNGDTSKAYIDMRWQTGIGSMGYIAFGIGAAFHNGDLTPVSPTRKALGSHILFHPSLELGLNLDAHNNVSVFFDHMSNANTQADNEGMDTLGVRYGYRF